MSPGFFLIKAKWFGCSPGVSCLQDVRRLMVCKDAGVEPVVLKRLDF